VISRPEPTRLGTPGPPATRALEFLPSALLLGLAACFAGPEDSSGAACVRDEDCPELCSRVNECLSAADAIEIRVSWTVGGQAPSPTTPGSCGAIDAFEVSLESDGERDEPINYFPVPCNLGQVYYDRMPNRLARVRMSAVHTDGSILEVVFLDIEGPSSSFQVNFNPQ
jgi:hypothetical protein